MKKITYSIVLLWSVLFCSCQKEDTLWAWAFLPALCAWDAWDGICGTRCKKDRRRWKAPPACLPLPHRVADLGDKFFWVPGLVGTDVVCFLALFQ